MPTPTQCPTGKKRSSAMSSFNRTVPWQPGSTIAVLASRLISTIESIRERSIRVAPCRMWLPDQLWPPERIDTLRPAALASLTALTTSSAVSARTITSGFWFGIRLFQTAALRASS